ncbi:MAG TPA: acyltransferase family protein [Candidatus Saccharimonadales bacterium]|nr:acyltransferase family protein [Candidatus Saccharimonadales bacterium]
MHARSRGRYIAGLDGLRALAVIAVLLYHFAPTVLRGGFVGVDVFFVISGFLITTLLIEEQARTGRIHFTKFWTRRARRLLPALLATVCVIGSIAFFARGDILVGLGRQLLGALTFSNNWVEVLAGANYFDAAHAHLFTNFWSLAVEEQFYAGWPFVVAALVGVPALARRPRIALWGCIAIAAISAGLMAGLFHGTNATRVYYGTDTHLFGLMIGAAIAFWARTQAGVSPSKLLNKKPFVQKIGALALVGLLAVMLLLSDLAAFAYRGGLVLASVLAALVLFATISQRSCLQRLFTWRPLVWVGVRSYGIYLWHWPLLVLLRRLLPVGTPWGITSLAAALLTVLAASLSYAYLESPIRAAGFWLFVTKGLRRQEVAIDGVIARWKLLPHPMVVASVAAIVLTFAAVIGAPSKTRAQLSVEAGQKSIQNAQQHTSSSAATSSSATPQVITGDMITVVGDSVTLASAPALEERWPGIFIDAVVSRSMRRGGLETVGNLSATGHLRQVVVVALGTNGYYGDGNLETLVTQLGNRKIILVTAHADREWTTPNNNDERQVAKAHHNVFIADWDAAISAHPEELGDDHIHPIPAGGKIYADSIAAALTQAQAGPHR